MSERQLSITDLCEDIKPGVLPIELLEILSKSTCGRYVKAPKTTFQRLENLNLFLEQLKIKSIKLVNIGAEDLAGGSRKLVLGLTWTLILAFEVNKAGINDLLEWVQEKVKSYGIVLDGGWQKGFSDGCAFCALVHDSEPTAFDFEGSQRLAPAERLTRAFSAAEKLMGVPQLLDKSDFVSDGKIDEKSIILYVTKLKQGREALDERRHIGTAEAEAAEAKAAEAAVAKKSAEKPNTEASKALASKVAALKAAAEATVAKKAAEKAAELQASEEAAERAAWLKSAAEKKIAAEEEEEAKKAAEKRAREEQEAAATLKAAQAASPASEEEAAKRAAWAKAAAEKIAAQEAAAAKATAAKAAGTAAVIEAKADGRAAAQAAEEEEARAAAEKVGLLLLRKDAEVRAAKARERAELAEAAMEEQLAAADRATLAMAEQLLMQRREHEAVLAEQLREQQRRLEAEMAEMKLQAAMGAQVSAAARLARAQEAMAEQLEEQQRQHEAAIRQQQVALEERLAAAARPAVGVRDVMRDVKMSFKRRTDAKNVGEPSAEAAREEDPIGNLLGTVARGVDEHVGKPVRQWIAKLSATEAKSLETVSKEAVAEASAKARLLEHRDELISEAAELSDWLGARRKRYDQAVGDPSKALLGSTADESRALLESLHEDCTHELVSMWHLARAANDGNDKCGKRWELKERFERLALMQAAYVEEMSKNTLPTQMDSVVGDVKEALAALDTQWDLMTASSTAYETALEERVDSHLEMGAFLNELELGSPMPVEPPTPGPLPEPGPLPGPGPGPVETPTPPPRSARKSEMERKRFLLGARNLDRAPMPPPDHKPQSSEKSREDADEKMTVESTSPTDKIMKPTKNAGEIMGMGAAETGKFFNSTGAAVGDGVKATGSLVISGLEKTFETLGVTAGFQAIFGEDIDKSEAGLEAAFAKVDKDQSGKISPEEMKAYIMSRYKKGLAEEAIDEMMATADTNDDGEIDLAEFKIIMRAGPQKSDGAIVGAVDASVAATVGGVKAFGDGAVFIGLQYVEGMKAAGAATVDSAKAVGTATVNVVKAVGTATVDGTAFVGKKGLEGAKVVGSATVDGVTFVGKKGLEGAKAVGDGVKAIEKAAAEKAAAEKAAAEKAAAEKAAAEKAAAEKAAAEKAAAEKAAAEKAAAEKAAAEKAAAEKAATDVESPAKLLSQHEASVLKARERIEQFMRGVSAELLGPPELNGTGFSVLVPREVVFNGAGEANLPSAAQAWNVQHTNSQRRAANMDVIQGIAKILKEYPQVLCEVHGETSPANSAPEPLAELLRLDPVRDVAECMGILAHKRAQACFDALVAAGVPPEQLFVTYNGMGGKVGVKFMPSTEAAARATSWPWRWEPGELAVDGSLRHVLEPLASFLEQNGIQVKHDKLAMHVEEDMLVVSEPVSPVRGAVTQTHRSQVHVPTLNVFCNGIEFANAAFSKWDRHLKTALKRFLNANLASSWGYGCTPLRTGFGFGTEWNVEAVTALQIFLKNNGADDLEITNQMGLSGHALFGICDNDPTIMALQAFLNRQMVPGALP